MGTLDNSDLDERVGMVPSYVMADVDRGLKVVLGLRRVGDCRGVIPPGMTARLMVSSRSGVIRRGRFPAVPFGI